MKRKVPNTQRNNNQRQNNNQNNSQKTINTYQKMNINNQITNEPKLINQVFNLNTLPVENKREIIKKIIEEQLKIYKNGITYLLKKNNSTEYNQVIFYKKKNSIMVKLVPRIPESIKNLTKEQIKQVIINITLDNYRRIFGKEMIVKPNFFRSNIKRDDLYIMYLSAKGIKNYTLEEIEKMNIDIYELIQLDTIQSINDIDSLFNLT